MGPVNLQTRNCSAGRSPERQVGDGDPDRKPLHSGQHRLARPERERDQRAETKALTLCRTKSGRQI